MVTDIHGWNDISTAPKDGTVIDLWCTGVHKHSHKIISRRFTDASWNGDHWYCIPKIRPHYKVSHWRPLPKKPIGL